MFSPSTVGEWSIGDISLSAPAQTLTARKLLWRDWRGGELGILLAALVLAVGVVVGISAFVASLQSALENESRRFLAADQVISSRQAIPEVWRDKARQSGLASASLVGFPSMVMNDGEGMTLASIKAVEAPYPLRGTLKYSEAPYESAIATEQVPTPGEVWLAPRLFALLDVNVGDPVWVGEASLTVAGAIRSEPDSTTAMFGYGPRLLMNVADLAATGVIQPGSRVSYRLLLGGSDADLATFVTWVEPQMAQGQRLLGSGDGQASVNRTLQRARAFLLLAGSLGVVLAAAAIALAARRFSERHTDYVAIMKSLGATSATVNRLYGSSLLLMGLIAGVLGCLVGWAIQALFFALFAEQLGVAPGPMGVLPFVIGATTAMVCLLFFAWPPLRRLALVSPLRVLRREEDAGSAQQIQDYVFGVLAMTGLMWWYSADILLTASVVGGLLVTVGVGFLLAKALLSVGRGVGSQAGSVWRLAMSGLLRRGNANALQMVIFGIAIMLMLVLVMVRTSLISQWQAQLPPGTPNHFAFNIGSEQRTPLAALFSDLGIRTEPLFPMTRGRVMAVNGRLLTEDRDELGANEGRQRESNFTYAQGIPEATRVVAGQWWGDTSAEEGSLEEEFAGSVGAAVGDTITLRVGADSFDATVTSIRAVDWESMKPNFFVIFPPHVLDKFPAMYITSFFLAPDSKGALNQIVRAFPTVTVIELDIVIEEVRSIVARVGQAIELVLAVILCAGALVLVAGVQSSVDVRIRESALLRALGARRGLLMGALAIEFTVLGLFAGCLAVMGAEVAAWGLQTQALQLIYAPTLWLWPLGVVSGMVIIGGVGVASCRKAVNVPPLVVLREL